MRKFKVAKEMRGPLTIGECYKVEVMSQRSWSSGKSFWLPIFGEIHADDLDTGVSPVEAADRLHVHIDMRFVTEEELEAMGWEPKTQGAVTVGLNEKFGNHIKDTKLLGDHAFVKLSTGEHGRLRKTWDVRPCLRQWTLYPMKQGCPGRTRFEDRYEHAKMRNNVCPHHGFDLSTMVPEKIEGRMCRVCPGHRLVWDDKTGEMVRRT